MRPAAPAAAPPAAWLRLAAAALVSALAALALTQGRVPVHLAVGAALYTGGALLLVLPGRGGRHQTGAQGAGALLLDTLAIAWAGLGLNLPPALVALLYACLLAAVAGRRPRGVVALGTLLAVGAVATLGLTGPAHAPLETALAPASLLALGWLLLGLPGQRVAGQAVQPVPEAAPGTHQAGLLEALTRALREPLRQLPELADALPRGPAAQGALAEGLAARSRPLLAALDTAEELAGLAQGISPLEHHAFSPEDIILNALAGNGGNTRAARLYLDPALPARLEGDARLCTRLLGLLLHQARQRSPTGPLQLVAGLERAAGGAPALALRVYATGADPAAPSAALRADSLGALCARLAAVLDADVLPAGEAAPAADGAARLLGGCLVPVREAAEPPPPALNGMHCALLGLQQAESAPLQELLEALDVHGVPLPLPPLEADAKADALPAELATADLAVVGAERAELALALRSGGATLPLLLYADGPPAPPALCAGLAEAGYLAALNLPVAPATLARTLARARSVRDRMALMTPPAVPQDGPAAETEETAARARAPAGAESGATAAAPVPLRPAAVRLPLLDQATVEQLQTLNEDPTFFSELVEGFIQDGEHSLAAIETAHARRDGPAAADHAYALKGSARSIGAAALAEACTLLARAPVAEPGAVTGLAEARGLFEHTARALTARLAGAAAARN